MVITGLEEDLVMRCGGGEVVFLVIVRTDPPYLPGEGIGGAFHHGIASELDHVPCHRVPIRRLRVSIRMNIGQSQFLGAIDPVLQRVGVDFRAAPTDALVAPFGTFRHVRAHVPMLHDQFTQTRTHIAHGLGEQNVRFPVTIVWVIVMAWWLRFVVLGAVHAAQTHLSNLGVGVGSPAVLIIAGYREYLGAFAPYEAVRVR